jgi:SOS-response transcriptional repressor LexA
MRDAGILPGDVVIVERTTAHKVGDIVIAEVDGEWTMKFLRERGHQPYDVAILFRTHGHKNNHAA